MAAKNSLITPSKQESSELKKGEIICLELIQDTRVQISFFVDAHNMDTLNISGIGAIGEIPYTEKNFEQVQPFVKRGLVIIKN